MVLRIYLEADRRCLSRLVQCLPNYLMNYYNEHDPKAATWLRELITAGLIPAGDVDTRSITQVSPDDLSNYTQCHFFAGIGGWSYALQLAGWPPSRRAWTGSCPCQPFSQAGKQMGRRDPRHLWPAFRRLINRCRPPIVFGEQVASADGRLWLAGVSANLETMGYATAAADLCAASVGAPHPRQRLYWMANDASERWNGATGVQGTHGRPVTETSGTLERMGIANGAGRDTRQPTAPSTRYGNPAESDGRACGMGNAHEQGREGESLGQLGASGQGHWTDYDILHCIDGKSRRIEPGTFPLADGVPGRVGLLRGYGNAIVPQVAAEFVMACSEILPLNTPAHPPQVGCAACS
jgi:DNA (cytosine-5)-methyltransferase 1